MKGIILAGGFGTRLSPLTKVMSKQLLPVYDKPMIYYALSTLMLANIKKILIISSPNHINKFQNLLGSGSELGIQIFYKPQEFPSGIAEAPIIGEEFLNGSKCALILGDNLFHGPGLGRRLEAFHQVKGAQIFGYHVNNPSSYGVAEVDSKGSVMSLKEKPENSISNIAIPGLYFFDENVPKFAKKIMPSPRGELEILDLLRIYQEENNLRIEMLPRGTAWFDSGTFEDLHEASNYVKIMQERTGERVGDPFEISNYVGG